MPINWADQEVKDRLLAAIIASFDGAINCREVARLYGGEATYNAIENFLRKPKAKAKELKAEAAGREGPAPSPARPRAVRAPKTPSKSDGVRSGRVIKPKKNGKVNGSSPIKQEVLPEDDDVFGSVLGDSTNDENMDEV